MARILIGNDDRDLLDTCREILEGPGHAVRAVASGRVALEIAVDWQPDLIIVDWVMPDMDGATAIGRLRQNAITASLPILMISGSVNARAMAAQAGADAFLAKPFTADDLIQAVNLMLAGPRLPAPDHA
jgi:CheY-like chemotaxis protein